MVFAHICEIFSEVENYWGEDEIGVFKLNWIEQRHLEFDMHEVHSGKKKKE